MSARGDAGRRARWAAKDKQWQDAQLHAALASWLEALPPHLIQRLDDGIFAIFGDRYRSGGALNMTREERARVADMLDQINLVWEAGQVPDDLQTGHEEISMSLEQALAANTAALEANTAALLKSGGAGGTTSTKTTKTTTEKPKASKTREELAAVMDKVKAAKGTPVAKALIADVGKPADGKLATVPEENIDALFAAAEAKLAEEEDM